MLELLPISLSSSLEQEASKFARDSLVGTAKLKSCKHSRVLAHPESMNYSSDIDDGDDRHGPVVTVRRPYGLWVCAR